MQNIKLKSGFTLVEVIITFSIVIFMAFIFGDYIVNSYKTMNTVDKFNESVESAKKSINIMNREIREANSAKNGSYAINLAGDREIIFYSDIDHDNETEKIRYYMEGTFLKKDVTEAGTASPYYSGQPNTSAISEYIENLSAIFTYYDENNTIIADPSANINQIRLARIYLEVGRSPQYIIETSVYIRNLK